MPHSWLSWRNVTHLLHVCVTLCQLNQVLQIIVNAHLLINSLSYSPTLTLWSYFTTYQQFAKATFSVLPGRHFYCSCCSHHDCIKTRVNIMSHAYMNTCTHARTHTRTHTHAHTHTHTHTHFLN